MVVMEDTVSGQFAFIEFYKRDILGTRFVVAFVVVYVVQSVPKNVHINVIIGIATQFTRVNYMLPTPAS